MFKPALIRAAIVLVAATGVAGTGIAAEPTSPQTRARMIKLIDELEKNPFGKDSKNNAAEVLTWLIDAPDVSVTVCTALLLEPERLEGIEGSSLAGQLMFEEARFILENPDKAQDAQAVHLAGVEGVLRSYAAMKAWMPGLSLDPVEKLVKMKAAGKLSAFVARVAGKCG